MPINHRTGSPQMDAHAVQRSQSESRPASRSRMTNVDASRVGEAARKNSGSARSNVLPFCRVPTSRELPAEFDAVEEDRFVDY